MADIVKRRKRKAIGLLACAIPGILAASGCQQGLPDVTPEEGTRVVQMAEPAAGELLRTLVNRLTAAIEEGGAAHAVDFCALDAIPITRLVEAGLEGDLALKRTTFRYRNESNAPDEAEELALRYFEEQLLTEGEAPSHYVQRVSEEELRYYKPLFVSEFCLQCHGDPGSMDPQVRAKLEANYPGDLATGYEAGDLRGLVRVSVPAALVQQ
ncbi:MAG: Tll0287-like domain-containing protein [Longimicrobiales bacterium]